MVIRACPKCKAYYADELLAFCFADGMPLISVDPGSELWSEGTRVIEAKTKQRRKLKWRRLAVSAMTTLMLMMVVSRSFTVETIPAGTAPTVAPSPSPSLVVSSLLSRSESPSPSPSEDSSPSHSDTSSPTKSDTSLPSNSDTSSTTDTSSPTDSDTSSPTIVYKISGRVMEGGQPLGGVKVMLEGSKLTSTTTEANGNYSFSDLRAGGSYTVTPRAQMKFAPASRSFNDLKQDGSADFLAQIKVYIISGQVTYAGQPLSGVKIMLEGSKLTSTMTDANGNYTFGELRAGGSYTVTPRAKVNLTPQSRTFTNLTQDQSANFSGVRKDDSPPGPGKDDSPPPPKCSDDDKSFEGKAIGERLSATWRQKIEGERARIIAENVRDGEAGEASLSPIEYQSAFPSGCKMAVITLTYTWLIKTSSPLIPARTLRVPKRKLFACSKVVGSWVCTY